MTFWDVWYEHQGKPVHTTFMGSPKPIANETTGKITGYRGVSPFGDPRKIVALAGYPEFFKDRLYTEPPRFSKNQRLFLQTSHTVLREVSDVTWRKGEWHYYVMPVHPSSRATSDWIPQSILATSKLAR